MTKDIFIHFDDADPAGILFFGNVFTLVHRTIEEMLSESSVGWKRWFQNPDMAVPIRHVEADFLRPLMAGQSYQVQLRVKSVSESSVQFESLFKKAEQLHAKVETTHTFVEVSEQGLQKMAVPEDIRNFLESQII